MTKTVMNRITHQLEGRVMNVRLWTCFKDQYPEVRRQLPLIIEIINYSLSDKLSVTYSKSSGPGGQNVNKCT